jgi:hypothetical protein
LATVVGGRREDRIKEWKWFGRRGRMERIRERKDRWETGENGEDKEDEKEFKKEGKKKMKKKSTDSILDNICTQPRHICLPFSISIGLLSVIRKRVHNIPHSCPTYFLSHSVYEVSVPAIHVHCSVYRVGGGAEVELRERHRRQRTDGGVSGRREENKRQRMRDKK